MRKIFFLILMVVAIQVSAQLPVVKIGEKIPEATLKVKDINGKVTSLNEQMGENGLLVIFSCNTCPFVVAWEDRYPVLADLTKNNQIGFVIINSNEAKREGDDSVEAMRLHAKNQKYTMPYLVDLDSKIANAFGAQTTPHVFLFDKKSNLVYRGAIDDNYKNASEVNEFYLKDAILELVLGKELTVNETRNLGCGIKRK